MKRRCHYRLNNQEFQHQNQKVWANYDELVTLVNASFKSISELKLNASGNSRSDICVGHKIRWLVWDEMCLGISQICGKGLDSSWWWRIRGSFYSFLKTLYPPFCTAVTLVRSCLTVVVWAQLGWRMSVIDRRQAAFSDGTHGYLVPCCVLLSCGNT
jgi:hypothetical protein